MANCEHLIEIQDVSARTPEGCEECLASGDLDLWARRMLRSIEESARDSALPCDRAPDYSVVPAGRRLALVLRG